MQKNNYVELIAISTISILPILFVVGSGIINVSIILLDLILLYELFKKKKISYLDNKYFYSLFSIWVRLLISLIFSNHFYDSTYRAIGFIRFVFFVFAIRYFFTLNNGEFKNIILNAWTIFLLIITFDLIYEYIFGVNILGFVSPMHGRLVSFLGDELKIGGLYFGILGLGLANLYIYISTKKNTNFYKDNFFYLMVILFLVTSFLVGERSNFVKVLLLLVLFIIFRDREKLLKKFLIIMGGFIIIFFITSSNDLLKYRFWTSFLKPVIKDPIHIIGNTQYGYLYKGGLNMFNNNKLFGVGLKNFRNEIGKDKVYMNAGSNHPHQFHIEILAELGVIGYLSFFIFFVFNLYFSIKYFLRNKDLIQLSALLFVFCSLIPLLPSGSFFSTFGASIFWLNFALMLPRNN
jgi:O-antigen ligase